jgi:hypothetical protein
MNSFSIVVQPIVPIDLSFTDVNQIQSYNPIYNEFISTTLATNTETPIGLNNLWEMVDPNIVYNKKTGEHVKKPVFIKYSPLLDPIRYLLGEYDSVGKEIRQLPSLKESSPTSSFTKLRHIHNSSYVDCFFYYLSSLLYHSHGFIHAVDFYGSYLGIQENFKMNITDDFDHLREFPLFFERWNQTYSLDSSCPTPSGFLNPFGGSGSRSNKTKIKINSTSFSRSSVFTIEDLTEVEEMKEDDESPQNNDTIEKIYERQTDLTRSSHTSDNSLLSYTTEGEEEEEEGEGEGEEEEEGEGEGEEGEGEEGEEEEEEDEEETIKISIHNFPCQMICLEQCKETLDTLLCEGEMDMNQAASCLFQIVMTLTMYQKMFKMTHNDLHTNNIMYIETDITHLVYHVDKKTYKVPTYGKIFKIIDFGRSFYQVNGKTFCSDSFDVKGDGYSQYNCHPFFNPAKPELLPNPSFDLCRLACSMYDFIIDEEMTVDEMDLFQQLIHTWCLDDSGRNVLYKQSGEERYPNFKLYKMIARTVHGHIPSNQLGHALFRDFLVGKKLAKKLVKKGEKIHEMTL